MIVKSFSRRRERARGKRGQGSSHKARPGMRPSLVYAAFLRGVHSSCHLDHQPDPVWWKRTSVRRACLTQTFLLLALGCLAEFKSFLLFASYSTSSLCRNLGGMMPVFLRDTGLSREPGSTSPPSTRRRVKSRLCIHVMSKVSLGRGPPLWDPMVSSKPALGRCALG